MIFSYGSYSHAADEVTFTVSKRVSLLPSGVIHFTTHRYDISGMLQAESQSALTTALAALEAAYEVQGGDIAFLDNSSAATVHALASADCMGGTRVVEPIGYPIGAGAEYTTWRSYSAAIEGDIRNTDSAARYIDWDEFVQFTGGGSRFVFLQTIEGPPQKQQVAQSTPYEAVQSGRAVGMSSWPPPPPPIWPDAEHRDRRQVTYGAPKRFGSGSNATNKEYSVEWTYFYSHATALSGLPHAQPS